MLVQRRKQRSRPTGYNFSVWDGGSPFLVRFEDKDGRSDLCSRHWSAECPHKQAVADYVAGGSAKFDEAEEV